MLPLLYLHGLSTDDFGSALDQFLGSDSGLSGASISRLTAQWQDGVRAFGGRDLSGVDYVYLWVTAPTSECASTRRSSDCW